MLEKVQKKALNSHEVFSIFDFMIAQNPLLKDVMGLSAFSNVVNGAYGQFFNNAHQSRVLPKEMLDDHRLASPMS